MSAYGVGEGDIRNCLGKLNDPGKPALRRLGILPQQIRASPMFAPIPHYSTGYPLYAHFLSASGRHGRLSNVGTRPPVLPLATDTFSFGPHTNDWDKWDK